MPPPVEPESLDFLLAQVCHLHYTRAHALLEAIGLYRGQPPVLRALWEQEGQTHTELARRLRVAPATVTRMIQRMEKAGFVVRRADPNDQRVSRVYLTEAGRTVRADVQAVWQAMDDETFAGFNAAERDQLRQLLTRVRANLLRASGECPPC